MRLQPAHLPRSQVRNHDNSLADHLLRRVPLGNAGENLPLLITKVNLQTKQLVSLRNPLSNYNLRHAKINLHEIINRNLRSIRSSRTRSGRREHA